MCWIHIGSTLIQIFQGIATALSLNKAMVYCSAASCHTWILSIEGTKRTKGTKGTCTECQLCQLSRLLWLLHGSIPTSYWSHLNQTEFKLKMVKTGSLSGIFCSNMDFSWIFFHHFAWTKRPKSIKIYEIYQNPTSASPDSNLALAKSFSSNKACDLPDTISVDVSLGSASRIEMIEMIETWLKLCRNMKNSQWTNVTCEDMKKAWSDVIQRLQQHYQAEVDHFGCCFCFKWPRLHLDIWRASRDHSKHPGRC